ncbi:GntR family transcriptional regulator [Pedobacter sp. Hv1]|uniref:GntR family transcriptional regulator n=1 Tax=Pedobacter sp. Hv1 TaxID=1740090 RepID=UPI0006D8D73B|nr:GntR family transcriptional regulator [Pedobacter sp. Hv1]KQC00883.1 GntR family transcriptional regulator [Pedobacter sp. Hv1]
MKNALNEQSLIKINAQESTPIYKQIVQSIRDAITSGKLKQGDTLPSVNHIAAAFSIARGSIFKAYNDLRNTGTIDSIPGKGYFVTNDNFTPDKNIFLLLSTFNPYREVLFNAFINEIKAKATVDIYFHHHNVKVFETLIKNHSAYYNTFVVMPVLHKDTKKILTELDQKRLYLLDSGMKELGNKYPYVCQNYEKDIYNFFESYKERLNNYKRVVLLFSSNSRSYDVITGFENFFKHSAIPSIVERETVGYKLRKGDLYIINDDNDLVHIITTAKMNGWVLGKDLGIVSYHETPLKSIIAEGITTITSDFGKMGTDMAKMVLNNKREKIANPFLTIERNSF